MGRGCGPMRGRPPRGEDGHPFRMAPLGWGPPPPGGWGPPPEDWGPPRPDWDLRGPPPPDWDPRAPLPPHWDPREPLPLDWDPRGPPPPDWDPRGPPLPHWDPRGPLPPDWDPRGLPPPDWDPLRPPPPGWDPRDPRDPRGPLPPGWGPHPDDWVPPPDWGHPDWRSRHPGWGPEGPPDPWGPEPVPPVPPPVPPVATVPPVPPIPPVLPPGVPPPPPVAIPPPDPAACPPGIPPPSFGFPAFPPPSWTGETVAEEPLPNPPPDQPEWIKALISAPPTETTPGETAKPQETPVVTTEPEPAPSPAVDPAPKLKPESNRTAGTLGLLVKRTFDKPPPGRSMGIISFIGPSFGYIEREDLEKYTFSFDVFFGNPKAMTPGVRVHFTACKEKKRLVATDVKVAPGGTENVGDEIYEAVVSQPISDPQPGERQYPGQVYVTIGPVRTNLPFERKDSTVTLLKNDQVLINVLTDIVTEKRRATNIKLKIPATFSHTLETREKGVIASLSDSEGIIKSDEHGKLPFDPKENLSDIEFTQEDINEEVEFTVIKLKAGKQAIRIQRAKEPLLLTLCSAADCAPTSGENESYHAARKKSAASLDLGPNMVLDTELYEGIVSQPIVTPKPDTQGSPGQIHANIGPIKTNVSFDKHDCGVTLLKNDHVLINLLVDTETKRRKAANIKPKIPFTFSYTRETRELGSIKSLDGNEGIIKSAEHGEIPFYINENFSDTEFGEDDIDNEVEFTVAQVKSGKRAIRLTRRNKNGDKILQEQKRREEEDRRRKKEEEEEREAEMRKKDEVAAALAAAKDKWTPFGFKVRIPDSMDEISKERFEGTVLRAISKNPRKEVKKELEDKEEEKEEGRRAEGGQAVVGQVKIKVEKMDEDEDKKEQEAGEERMKEIKKEKQEEKPEPVQPGPEMGRVVMTVNGEQKQLSFGPKDLMTTATMLVGDKVRFNIATHRETTEERATFVDILPDSFEESTEQRHHGIVIEFSVVSGLIKCSQNPQLYFSMSEVIERKRLELNEKVEFSIVPHDTAEGGNQAIRIKRFTEKVFLPVRKLGGVGANKGKMTIKLAKPSEENEKEKQEADKLKTVVKNLRKDYSISRRKYSRSKSRSRSRSRSRSHSRVRSKSRSPSRDKYGRIIKKRRSPSVEHKTSRSKRSRERSYRRIRGKSKSRSRSRSSSRSRSRSRERSRDVASRKRSKTSREREDAHRRRRELSPPRREGVVDTELARKKRELEELNEMIAYKKSLVDIDPRGLEPGQRTCIDYDHGRISMPLAEYKPVRSILKKRPGEPEYLLRPPYDDPYYDRTYDPYHSRRYGEPYADPYASHPYAERPYDRQYAERLYESRRYAEPPYGGLPSTSRRYTDRYDVYDEPYDERLYDPYTDRPYDPYPPVKRSRSPEPRGSSPPSQSGEISPSSKPSLTHPSATSSPQSTFRPPSPIDSPPRSPSPKQKVTPPRQSPPTEKPPLDRFLDMLNKRADAEKKPEPAHVTDDLLPHERALQDGRGFSRIVGLAQEVTGGGLAQEEETREASPKRSSVERKNEEEKAEPYDKIQSLLRTIGLKLSSGDMSKLASRAQDKIYSPKSLSAERETYPSAREEMRTTRTGSVELDSLPSPSPVRSSSAELVSRQKTSLSEYEEFLDQQELEVLKKAQKLQSLTKTMGRTPSTTTAPKPPPGPPPAHYQHPSPPLNWPLGISSQTSTSGSVPAPPSGAPLQQRLGLPPGPPPGPPPRHPAQPPPGPPPGPPPRRLSGPPSLNPTSTHSVLPFIGQVDVAPPNSSSSPSQASPSAMPPTSTTSTSLSCDQTAISTTVARCLKVIETVKSLSTQPSAKPVKSVQFSLPTESTSGVGPLASVETDDDVKTKQKEKLDLYNQRLMEKRELQYKEMLFRKKQGNKDGQLVSPGKLIVSEPKNVWICGHSLVYWAESRAKSPEVGMQLGMDPSKVTIWWKGIQGMTWPQLLPQLHQLKISWPNPDVLLVHLGGNDLSTESPTNLLASVKKDLTSLRGIFPQCLLVWSNILPRRAWRHSQDSDEVDLVRTTVNRRIQNIVSELGGTSLSHDNIRCGMNIGLYRPDGIHLSPKGIDVFNLNLQDFLEKWEAEMNSDKSSKV